MTQASCALHGGAPWSLSTSRERLMPRARPATSALARSPSLRPRDPLSSGIASSRVVRAPSRPRIVPQGRVAHLTPRASASTAAAGGRAASPGRRAAVVGGGPAGLAAALMLARRGWGVDVWERLSECPTPEAAEWGNPERSYNLGVNGRGQEVLKSLGALERVVEWSSPIHGRREWVPGKRGAYDERVRWSKEVQEWTTVVLQRDRLAACLLAEIREQFPSQVMVRHNVEVTEVDLASDPDTVTLTLGASESSEQTGEGDVENQRGTYDLVIGADGVNSVVTRTLESVTNGRVSVQRFADTNPRVYRTIPLSLPSDWKSEMNYSFRTREGPVFEALPTKEGMLVGLVLFEPDYAPLRDLSTAAEADAALSRLFPHLRPHFKAQHVARFAEQRISKLPTFSFAGPELHLDKRVALIGDAIHTVKPYFGLGVNSAFNDVDVLARCLDKAGNDTSIALPDYTNENAEDAKALVRMSRQADQGIVFFVVPIILDTIFSKLLPSLFTTTTIRMLQRGEFKYAQVGRMKRRERIMQVTLITVALALAAFAVKAAVGAAVVAVRGALGM